MVVDPILLLIISGVILLVLLATGMKVAVALMVTGAVGFLIYKGQPGLSSIVPFSALNNFIIVAIPLFIFMGEILMHCGFSHRLYSGVTRWLAWLPGGLLHSNIGACAMFAAVSGSSPATAATIGTVAIPELGKRGYDQQLVLGTLAAGGTLGILIPPSMTMIVFAMLAQCSVGALFIGGVIPGLILSLMFMFYIAVKCTINPQLASREAPFAVKSAILAVFDVWPLLLLSFIVLGGIFMGLCTATEAAAIGASVALILGIIHRRLSVKVVFKALTSTAETISMVLIIVVGATVMASFFAQAGIPTYISVYIFSLDMPKYVIMAVLYLFYIGLGCFLDPLSMMVLTLPTVLPVISALGFDIVWFGITLVVLVEMGMVTPPVGLNLFIIQGLSGVDLIKVFRSTIPFLFIMLLCVVLLTVFPSLALWLPSLMR